MFKQDKNNRIVLKEFNEMLEVAGLRINFCAKKLGLSKSVLSTWRNGKYNYSIETLRKIRRFVKRAKKIAQLY